MTHGYKMTTPQKGKLFIRLQYDSEAHGHTYMSPRFQVDCGFLPWRPVLAREREGGGGLKAFFATEEEKYLAS